MSFHPNLEACLERLENTIHRLNVDVRGRGYEFAGVPERDLLDSIRFLADSKEWSDTGFGDGYMRTKTAYGYTVSIDLKKAKEAASQGRLREFLETEVAIAKVKS